MPQIKKTMIIGASPNPARYAFIAANMLREYGHPILLFGVKRGAINGQKILNEWPETEEPDTITLYVNPKIQKDYYQRIIDMHPKRIIFNPGTENPELEQLAESNGIEALEACTLVLLRTNQF